MNRTIHLVPKKDIPFTELCIECMQRKYEFLCDMPDTPKLLHYFDDNGNRHLEINRTCDRQLCRKCAIELAPNVHCCKKCADRIIEARLEKYGEY